MHRNKHKASKPKPPETRTPSEAVKELAGHVIANANLAFANFEAMALRDAQLDPKDGWRFDFNARVFVRMPSA